MAAFSGTNIVNTGLIFHFDFKNSVKSWKDKPTSNLRAGTTMSSNYQGNTAVADNNYNLTAPDGSTGWSSFTISQVNSNPRCGTFAYTSQPANTTYTYSIELFNPGPDTFQIFIDGAFGTGHTNIPLGYSKWSFVHTTSVARTQSIWFGSANQNTSVTYSPPRLVYFKNYQVEEGGFATKHVSGTRSNTESIIDLSPNKNTITTANLTYRQSDSPTFDGTDDYLNLPNDLGYTTSVSAFAWFKHVGAPTGGYHIILGGQELEISIYTTGYLRTGVYTSAGRFVSNHGSGLVDGNWHMVGFTFNGSTKTSYVNGVSVGTQSVTGILTSSFADRCIGRYGSSTSYYMNGEISQIKIYNRELTSLEVLQNFESTKPKYNV